MYPFWRSYAVPLLAILLISSARAQVIHVPGNVPTIQEALNRAGSGTTVLVEPGSYREQLLWPDRNGIRLIGAGDSSNTSIVGDGDGPVVLMRPRKSRIDTLTVIRGFEITGGRSDLGGGIALYGASPLLERLWIRENRALDSGGGIFVKGSPYLRYVRIEANSASEDLSLLLSGGGGIFVDEGSPTMLHVHIIRNAAATSGLMDAGGGIFMNVGSRLHFEDGHVEGNAAHEGGGLFLRGQSFIRRVRIVGNRASRMGGGISAGNLTQLNDVVISTNQSLGMGGGAYFFGTTTVDHATISHNHARGDGAGVYVLNGAKLNAVTIAHNTSDKGCGGVSVQRGFMRRKTALSHVNMVGNGLGICNSSGQTLRVDHAWFGHPTGPGRSSATPFDRGDVVQGPIDTPFWHSLPDSVAPPTPVEDVLAVAVGTNKIDVEWTPSRTPTLRGYQISTSTSTTRLTFDHVTEISDRTHHTISFEPDAQPARVGIRVVDSRGRSSWWTTATVE